jgi:LPXTG-motif cell wall-anchored protein
MGVTGGAVAGATAGAELGSVVPGIGNVLGAVGGAVIGAIGGLFKRKTFVLWYWDPSQCAWIVAGQGKSPALKKEAKKYKKDGIKTTIIKPNIIPKPLACELPKAGSGLNVWIFAGIAAAGLVLWLLLRKKA